MTYFDHLRAIPWSPTFTWVPTAHEAADRINRPHEDYPLRVSQTELALLHVRGQASVPNTTILEVHRIIFGDKPFVGSGERSTSLSGSTDHRL